MNFQWLLDRKVRLPRIWSNQELKKFAKLFSGDVVNVSAWLDRDKQGSCYKEYFTSASNYWITNHAEKSKGLQEGMNNQIALDLEEDLPDELYGRFEVVFNHTVLEHVFDCNQAFANLCHMSSDIVIVVVPFIQHQHAAYGDYWRFTPECIERLFKINGLELLYINFNDGSNQSIYILAIGSKQPGKWSSISGHADNQLGRLTAKVGYRVVSQGLLFRLFNPFMLLYHKLSRASGKDQVQ